MNKFFLISPLLLQTAIWVPTIFFLRFFCHFRVMGLENLEDIKKGDGVIFAVNHSSELDPILVPAALPFLSHLMPMFYVSKTADFYDTSGFLGKILYGGFFFKIWGAHPVHKTEKKGDYEFILKDHIELLEKGKSLCVFPEGQKTSDGDIKDGKPGVAFLSYKTKVSIVPVKIGGAFRMTLKKLWAREIYVTINVGKPLRPEDLFEEGGTVGIVEYKKVARKVMETIEGTY